MSSSAPGRATGRPGPSAGVVAIVALVCATLLAGAMFLGRGFHPFGLGTESHTSEVVRAIRTEEQVVLVRLGIQGIEEKRTTARIGDVAIPWTDRSVYLKYSFDASLGIEGKDVQITKDGDKRYRLTAPRFLFLGYDNVDVKVAVEKNGALSFTTPEIDKVAMVDAILDDGGKQTYVDANTELLRRQAQEFYRGIIQAVDPGAEVTFDVTG